MTTVPAQNFGSSSYSPRALCRIVGFACLAGFLVDLFVLTFPPALGNIEWRIAFMQQLGDRAIILLFGLALIMYGILDYRQWRRRLALACLGVGILFCLSSVLVIRDSLTFQQQALNTISTQANQIQTQIQKAQEDPKSAPQSLTAEQLSQASRALSAQAETVKQNTKTGVLRTGISSVGNLVVVGLALLGLGQYGARPPKA